MITIGLLGCLIYIFIVGYYIAARTDKWLMSMKKGRDVS